MFLQMLISKDDKVFAGTYGSGIYSSTDFGGTWIFSGIPGLVINSFALSGNNIFAGLWNSGVYLSTNNGDNWNAASNGMNNASVTCMTANGINVFASSYDQGIFRTTNNGASWVNINSGLTNIHVQSITSDGTNVFAGTQNSGVFVTTNNGESWFNKNEGLMNPDIYFMSVANNYVFAGTVGSSIWKRPISEMVSVKNISNILPDKFELYQNYPNPFNPTTNIRYKIPKDSHVIMKVFDVRGIEICTLIDAKQNAGIYEVNFDGSKFASGIYFYKIEAKESNSQILYINKIKKMVLIK
jgi:hypothetical protein